MRAWDLAIFVIMIEMSIGFIAGLGFYDHPSLMSVQNGEINRYQTENINETFAEKPTIADYLKFSLDWVFASFNMFIMIVSAFVGISWILYTTFKLPLTLCFFIQGIVYLIYTWGFIQWRSGRGGQAFE